MLEIKEKYFQLSRSSGRGDIFCTNICHTKSRGYFQNDKISVLRTGSHIVEHPQFLLYFSQSGFSLVVKNDLLVFSHCTFYRTQVYLNWHNWCDSGWRRYLLTDNVNRAIQGSNVAMQVTQPGGQICNCIDVSGAVWWPNLQLVQVVLSGGEICN